MSTLAFASIRWNSREYHQTIDLRNRILRHPLGLEVTAQDQWDEQDESHFGIFDGERLIACLVAVDQSNATVKLRQMAVEPQFQRRGVGSWLISQVEAALQACGTKQIKLHARQTAIDFYRRLGYQTQGDEFIEVTLPHIVMSKQFSDKQQPFCSSLKRSED